MKKLDKKQVPQVIALAVLACAVFGWFAIRLFAPTSAGAHSPAASATTPAASTAAAAVASADVSAKVAPPGPNLRDPFVPAISGAPGPAPAPAPVHTPVAATPAVVKPVKVASLPPVVPIVPALPPNTSAAWVRETPTAPAVAPLAVVIPPPNWTVTGVLASGSEHVAILRNGDARRFVKKGDGVDGLFVVSAVTSDSVTLRHGSRQFVLPLGGGKIAAPSAPRHTAPLARPAPPTLDMTQASRPSAHVAQAPRVRLAVPVRRLAVKPAARKAVHQALCAPSVFSPSLSTPSAPVTSLLPVGSLAPDFSLQTLVGGMQSLSQHRGQVVLLHFWSSWNPASQAGLPLLEQLHSEYSPQGLAILSVNSWDNVAALRPFLTRQGMDDISVLYDPSVANDSVAVRLYKVDDISTTYVINQKGDVAASFVGYSPKTLADIRHVLASLGVS